MYKNFVSSIFAACSNWICLIFTFNYLDPYMDAYFLISYGAVYFPAFIVFYFIIFTVFHVIFPREKLTIFSAALAYLMIGSICGGLLNVTTSKINFLVYFIFAMTGAWCYGFLFPYIHNQIIQNHEIHLFTHNPNKNFDLLSTFLPPAICTTAIGFAKYRVLEYDVLPAHNGILCDQWLLNISDIMLVVPIASYVVAMLQLHKTPSRTLKFFQLILIIMSLQIAGWAASTTFVSGMGPEYCR